MDDITIKEIRTYSIMCSNPAQRDTVIAILKRVGEDVSVNAETSLILICESDNVWSSTKYNIDSPQFKVNDNTWRTVTADTFIEKCNVVNVEEIVADIKNKLQPLQYLIDIVYNRDQKNLYQSSMDHIIKQLNVLIDA